MKQFYVYTHSRPDGSVFYVGKGTIKRSMKLSRPENPHHINVVNKYGRKNIIVRTHPCRDEGQAFDLERMMISGYRASGIKLVNMTDGGEGSSGTVVSAETRVKMSVARKGKKASPEAIQAQKDAFTPERRAAMSLLHKGRRISDETRAAISRAKKGVKKGSFSDEWRANLSASRMGKKASPETCAVMSLRMVERNAAMTPDQRSAAAKRASLKATEAMANKTPEELALIAEKKRQGSVNRWKNTTPEQLAALKAQRSASAKAQWANKAIREKMVESLQGKALGFKHTDESKAKMSASRVGKGVGRKHTDEAKAKMSAARRGVSPSGETRAKLSESGKGKTRSPEACENMKAAWVIRKSSKE